KAADLDGRKLALSETVASLAAKGVSFDTPLPPDAPAILIAADEPDGIHWRVGYNNFFVITRYNHSALYAMAVFELAAAVKQRILANDAAAVAAPSAASSAASSASSSAASSATSSSTPLAAPLATTATPP
ncbi:MAG TPA: lytic murein transglycosylase, partial [Steroidobacteraceae bacterium]